MKQVVPHAFKVDTKTYPLFVPEDIHNSDDTEAVFRFLVTAWVFTAWLRKRFPKADIIDVAMHAGMAAWMPTKELLKFVPEMKKRYPNHPKTEQNIAMFKCLDEDFTLKREVTKEEFEEAKAYNDQAVAEIEALFPCDCGQCPDHPSKVH